MQPPRSETTKKTRPPPMRRRAGETPRQRPRPPPGSPARQVGSRQRVKGGRTSTRKDEAAAPAGQDSSSDIGHFRAARGRENRLKEGCPGMPMLAGTQNVVHNDSRGAGLPRGTTKPLMGASGFGVKPDVEPLGRVAPDGQSLQRGPGRLLRCQKGTPGEATAIASRLGGPGAADPMGAAPRRPTSSRPPQQRCGRGRFQAARTPRRRTSDLGR